MTTDSDSAVSGGICITFDQNENISFAIYFCPCKVYIYIYTYIYYIIDLYIYIYICTNLKCQIYINNSRRHFLKIRNISNYIHVDLKYIYM